MCLEKANLVQQTDDIVCYKVLKGWKYDDILYSPYRDSEYVVGKKKKLKRTQPELFRTDKGNLTVGGGAYHSFITKEQAKKWCKIMSDSDFNTWHSGYLVVECIIPKTAKYVYKGIFGDGTRKENGYASSEIKPIKVVYQSI